MYLALALECKLNENLLDSMTLGMVLDYINEYQDLKNPNKKKNTVRKATQADFDSF